MKLFDHLNVICETKENLDFGDEDVEKSYDTYIINRFVSMSEVFIPLVNAINRFDVPKFIHHTFLKFSLPKRKQYFKYIKGEKSKDDLFYIKKYFDCGNNDLKEYMKILSDEEINTIVSLYKSSKRGS
jgi:hypothetical protein